TFCRSTAKVLPCRTPGEAPRTLWQPGYPSTESALGVQCPLPTVPTGRERSLNLELQRAANHIGIVLGPRDIGMPQRGAETLLARKNFQRVRMKELTHGMPLGDHFVCRAECEILLQAEEPCCWAIGGILGLELGRGKEDSPLPLGRVGVRD